MSPFVYCFYLIFVQVFVFSTISYKFTHDDVKNYREKIVRMFYHGYDNYISHAYPYDELRPLSCDGADTWGSFSLTLIDALDTLVVIGNYSEFGRVAQLIVDTANFDVSINVSVFETNIRVVGGLLSAHLLMHKAGVPLEPGWPCSGPLLRLAENMARRLLPAFQTETGMPYGTVNLRSGVPTGETPITCTAGVATFIVEFGTLSRLTGDPIFEKTAMKALNALWKARSPLGMAGNHIDVQTGKWTALDSGIGAGVDSYYEYLVKGSVLLQKPELMSVFEEYRKTVNQYMKRDDWYMWVNMQKGQITLPVFQSLEAYWPGLLSLVGDIDSGMKSLHNYHQVWKQFGFHPEFYNIPNAEASTNREGYPLRPEFAESIMYLYRATNDPVLLQMGVDILESIQFSAYTPCGYATIKDVRNHQIEDRMESFFLAETTKYLYLLFDPDNFLHQTGGTATVINTTHGECLIESGGYVFNTEAHPIDIAAVHCCGALKEDLETLKHFHDSMNLLALFELDEDADFLQPFKNKKNNEDLQANTTNEKLTNMSTLVTNGSELINDSQEEMVNPTIVPSSESVQTAIVSLTVTSDGDTDKEQPKFSQKNEEVLETTEVKSVIKVNRDNVDSSKAFQTSCSNDETNNDKKVDLKYSSDEETKSVSTEDIRKMINEALEGIVKSLGNFKFSSGESDEQQQHLEVKVSEKDPQSNRWVGTTPNLVVDRDQTISTANINSESTNGELNKNNAQDMDSYSNQYDALSCPAQPFKQRLSVLGEMFLDK